MSNTTCINSVATIDVTEAQQLLSNDKNILLIDVREPAEWDEGYIPRALHLPKGTIQDMITQHAPDKATQLILYCRGGMRSVHAANSLIAMGYQNVSSMAGGIIGWLDAGYPIVETY